VACEDRRLADVDVGALETVEHVLSRGSGGA
jgi:hypothetical protein